jgi:hypothetical protein
MSAMPNEYQRFALELIEAAEAVVCTTAASDPGKVIVGIRVDPKKLSFIGVVPTMDSILDVAKSALTAGERHG